MTTNEHKDLAIITEIIDNICNMANESNLIGYLPQSCGDAIQVAFDFKNWVTENWETLNYYFENNNGDDDMLRAIVHFEYNNWKDKLEVSVTNNKINDSPIYKEVIGYANNYCIKRAISDHRYAYKTSKIIKFLFNSANEYTFSRVITNLISTFLKRIVNIDSLQIFENSREGLSPECDDPKSIYIVKLQILYTVFRLHELICTINTKPKKKYIITKINKTFNGLEYNYTIKHNIHGVTFNVSLKKLVYKFMARFAHTDYMSLVIPDIIDMMMPQIYEIKLGNDKLRIDSNKCFKIIFAYFFKNYVNNYHIVQSTLTNIIQLNVKESFLSLLRNSIYSITVIKSLLIFNIFLTSPPTTYTKEFLKRIPLVNRVVPLIEEFIDIISSRCINSNGDNDPDDKQGIIKKFKEYKAHASQLIACSVQPLKIAARNYKPDSTTNQLFINYYNPPYNPEFTLPKEAIETIFRGNTQLGITDNILELLAERYSSESIDQISQTTGDLVKIIIIKTGKSYVFMTAVGIATGSTGPLGPGLLAGAQLLAANLLETELGFHPVVASATVSATYRSIIRTRTTGYEQTVRRLSKDPTLPQITSNPTDNLTKSLPQTGIQTGMSTIGNINTHINPLNPPKILNNLPINVGEHARKLKNALGKYLPPIEIKSNANFLDEGFTYFQGTTIHIRDGINIHVNNGKQISGDIDFFGLTSAAAFNLNPKLLLPKGKNGIDKSSLLYKLFESDNIEKTPDIIKATFKNEDLNYNPELTLPIEIPEQPLLPVSEIPEPALLRSRITNPILPPPSISNPILQQPRITDPTPQQQPRITDPTPQQQPKKTDPLPRKTDPPPQESAGKTDTKNRKKDNQSFKPTMHTPYNGPTNMWGHYLRGRPRDAHEFKTREKIKTNIDRIFMANHNTIERLRSLYLSFREFKRAFRFKKRGGSHANDHEDNTEENALYDRFINEVILNIENDSNEIILTKSYTELLNIILSDIPNLLNRIKHTYEIKTNEIKILNNNYSSINENTFKLLLKLLKQIIFYTENIYLFYKENEVPNLNNLNTSNKFNDNQFLLWIYTEKEFIDNFIINYLEQLNKTILNFNVKEELYGVFSLDITISKTPQKFLYENHEDFIKEIFKNEKDESVKNELITLIQNIVIDKINKEEDMLESELLQQLKKKDNNTKEQSNSKKKRRRKKKMVSSTSKVTPHSNQNNNPAISQVEEENKTSNPLLKVEEGENNSSMHNPAISEIEEENKTSNPLLKVEEGENNKNGWKFVTRKKVKKVKMDK
jgi:hypothetical protein